MLITTRQKRQNLPLKCSPISIGKQTVNEVDNHKVLGVTIDCNLSWSSHMTALCKSISKKVYQLSQIKHFLNLHARKLFCHAHIQSIIDYRSTLWNSASANTLKPLVSLHKRAIKAILKNTTLAISDYNFLSILPLKERLNYNKGVLIDKMMSGKVPPSLWAKFSQNQSRHFGKLNIPVSRIDLFKSSLVYSGSVLWNSLPDSLRLPPSTETFKSRYMSYIVCHFMLYLVIVTRLKRFTILCVSHLSLIYPPNVCCC